MPSRPVTEPVLLSRLEAKQAKDGAPLAAVTERMKKTIHNRLAAADTRSKVAIVAVMRKMLTMFNAMVRDHATWQTSAA